jgi:hypothetical protein
MNRPAFALACLLAFRCANVLAQSAPDTVKIADVTWRDVIDHQGNRMVIPVFAVSGPDRRSTRLTLSEHKAVVAVDERWRVAKLANDLQAMEQILSADFVETNQNGNTRNKTEMIQLWSTFNISSLITERATIRLAGDVAIMTGEQIETNQTAIDRMLFTRVYVRAPSKEWQLLSSTQFRNPRPASASAEVSADPASARLRHATFASTRAPACEKLAVEKRRSTLNEIAIATTDR